MRAREIRGDFTFGEQILDIADDGTNDWVTAKNGALVPNKELVLRSKLRIEARQFHMSRLHVQTWGEKQTIDIKSDWALLSEDERKRKADELIAMIRALREPPMQPLSPRGSAGRARTGRVWLATSTGNPAGGLTALA